MPAGKNFSAMTDFIREIAPMVAVGILGFLAASFLKGLSVWYDIPRLRSKVDRTAEAVDRLTKWRIAVDERLESTLETIKDYLPKLIHIVDTQGEESGTLRGEVHDLSLKFEKLEEKIERAAINQTQLCQAHGKRMETLEHSVEGLKIKKVDTRG